MAAQKAHGLFGESQRERILARGGTGREALLALYRIFPGDRAAVRRQAVDQALTMVLDAVV